MKNTFKRLNDEKIDLSAYEDFPLTDVEKRAIKKRIKSKLKSRKKSRKKLLVAAASLAAFMFLIVKTHLYIFTDIPIIGSIVEEYIPCKGQSLKDYQTVIGETVVDNGIIVKFNEVILDDERLIISSTFQSHQVNLADIMFPIPKVCINGQEMIDDGVRESIKINDSTYTYLAAISLENVHVEDKLNMNIVYENIEMINPDNPDNPVQLSGKWRFTFTASGEELLAESKKIALNKIFTLENGQKITVEELIITPASTKLNYKVENGLEYDVNFNIENQYGEQIFLRTAGILNEISYNRFIALDENTTKLKITPYISREAKEAGEKGTNQVLYDKAFYVDIK